MSTQFIGEGNIGSPPEYREFPNGNDDPRRLLRLNVYFDNPVPTKGGEFEDRGGFWAPVELWHHDADRWQQLYQKGMRVLVVGRMERAPWTDNEDQPRETWQINARSVGILPYRIEYVTLSPKPQEAEPKPPGHPGTSGTEGNEAQEVTVHGGRLLQCFAALHALRTIPRG
ncbi:ssb5 [Bordetella petrii]|uniref:Single-stranded DNA-binding protein n=1 Tax=Bordetella petrii (strain ATCC BAA-461 / DSM 12804 / CCUG 43448 / CIP 107267 / Se-1111R) TaxID=340100 RepID=A9IAA1_BORPD|nr:ssb5 [Bordetella petrii]